MYQLFFKWDKSDKEKRNLNFDDADIRNSVLDEVEEKKKRLQLKLDQELIEFEDKGGFAQVLKEIFNPQDANAVELDSVF